MVSRGAVLVMTIASCAVGGMLARSEGAVALDLWLLCLIGLVLAHATNNQLNDLVDHARGVDDGNYFRNLYGTHPLEIQSRSELLRFIGGTAGGAAAIGLWLFLQVGTGVVFPMLMGAFLVVCYTHPLKTLGLGEIAVWLTWGPLMVAGTHLAVAEGQWDWRIASIGLVYGSGPTLVILGKHIDKLQFDRSKGVRTLPVRLGDRRARALVQLLAVLEMPGVVGLVLINWVPPTLLIVLFGLPGVFRLVQRFQAPAPTDAPAGYPAGIWPLWFAAAAFSHARRQGGLWIAGLGLGLLWQGWSAL